MEKALAKVEERVGDLYTIEKARIAREIADLDQVEVANRIDRDPLREQRASLVGLEAVMRGHSDKFGAGRALSQYHRAWSWSG